MKTVKELKKEIDKIMLSGYTYETYLSQSEYLIDISNGLAIGTKQYKVIVDTQFLRFQEITYDEILLCKNIIDILEKNKTFVLKR